MKYRLNSSSICNICGCKVLPYSYDRSLVTIGAVRFRKLGNEEEYVYTGKCQNCQDWYFNRLSKEIVKRSGI